MFFSIYQGYLQKQGESAFNVSMIPPRSLEMFIGIVLCVLAPVTIFVGQNLEPPSLTSLWLEKKIEFNNNNFLISFFFT